MKPFVELTAVMCICAICLSCTGSKAPQTYVESSGLPEIYPDYVDVTVPPNIAPLHFMIDEKADEYFTRLSWNRGEWITDKQKVRPSLSVWRKMLKEADKALTVEVFVKHGEKWTRHKPFHIYVAQEEIDPYLSYRLIAPSYVMYLDLTISQRNLTNYKETVIYGNQINNDADHMHCINCHSYQNYNPNRLQFHIRESYGGTLIAYDGKIIKVNLKTDSLISSGAYPAWHPTKKLIAYAIINTGQVFHTRDLQKIEVQDCKSDLALYDIDNNEVIRIIGDPNELEVYPWWSPDGNYLYYASALFIQRDTPENLNKEVILRYKDIKYNLYRRSYNQQTEEIGEPELVFNADTLGMSATYPRISPDGRWLLFTLAPYGVFHIWHKDADLYLMDLKDNSVRALNEVNSDDVESYHCWSSNGRWFVFSSRRYDGNYTRPFIAYFDKNGRAHKPFELPQDDPDYHRQLLRSYNLPEFMKGPVTITPQQFGRAVYALDDMPAKQKN